MALIFSSLCKKLFPSEKRLDKINGKKAVQDDKCGWELHAVLCNPMFRSEEMEIRSGRDWSHTALKTRFWWAFIDWEGLCKLYLISNRWITGSAEPDVRNKPSGDQAWLINADWDSLLSCFHPKACNSVCLSLISYNRSCFPGVLHVKEF